MAVALIKEEPDFAIRRFEIADLSEHGGWIMERLLKIYPHMNERGVAGWLRGIVASADFLFLYHPNAVALAQTVQYDPLDPKMVVREAFVWAKDPENKAHVAAAAEFYEKFTQWAKAQMLDVVIVEERTDVPHDTIKDKLGRVFTKQQNFARV